MPVSAERQRELRQIRTANRIAELQAEGKSGRARAVARKSKAARRNTRTRSVAVARANQRRAERGRAYAPDEKVWLNSRFTGSSRSPHAELAAAEREGRAADFSPGSPAGGQSG